VPPISIADELRKLAKLKDEGIITGEEFKQMKQDLIRKGTLSDPVLHVVPLSEYNLKFGA
jgi:hypothetical protein